MGHTSNAQEQHDRDKMTAPTAAALRPIAKLQTVHT